ncbi:MAG: hydrolase TatD [Clostridiaceae bacterium]|nr:hydrolase TatD [Clostridiaceae bacterium]
MIIDAHLHITEDDEKNKILDCIEKENILALVAGTNPEDCHRIHKMAQRCNRIIPTYGLHPWYADKASLKDMEPYLASCPVIGEIGLDSVWCDVDLNVQRKIFVAQLDLAEKRGCPVILHTKGQEKEIALIIADYTVPVIVHWYSSENFLDKYLERVCYFTVGPDVHINPAVQQVVREVPLDRLFVESDGISAVEWATGKAITPQELPSILSASMDFIAKAKNVDPGIVRTQMEENLARLLKSSDPGFVLNL